MPASFERRMHPAHVPMIGIASSVARRTISSNSPSFTRSFEIVVLSPPGIVRASTRPSSSGRRTAIASPSFPYSRIAATPEVLGELPGDADEHERSPDAKGKDCRGRNPRAIRRRWECEDEDHPDDSEAESQDSHGLRNSKSHHPPGFIRPRGDIDFEAGDPRGLPSSGSAVLLIRRTGAADQLRDDAGESLRVGEEAESLARDAADHDLVPRMRRVAGPQDLVTLRQDRLAHRRVPEGVRMALVERDDLEEALEQDRTAKVPEDRHADAVHPGIEGGVLLDRLAVDADLEEVEFRGATAERRDVPVSKSLDGERR